MRNDYFKTALDATLGHEGVYSADKYDKGGQTFMGISRVYWPKWSGWVKIDRWLVHGDLAPDLEDEVADFYLVNFWDRVQGDLVAKTSFVIASELFDTAVNLGVTRAVEFLQTALNMQNSCGKTYQDLKVDGKLGPMTIAAMKTLLVKNGITNHRNETILLNCMNGEQYICYKGNPQHEYFRGWFLRV